MGQIKVNDIPQKADTPVTLGEVMKANKVLQPEMVSVQLNGKFVNREDFADTLLEDGDEVDFLYFMGGGRA